MKQKNFFRIFIYTCILITATARVSAQADEKQKLIALEKRRFDAMVRHDTTVLDGLLADSLIYIHSSGVIDNKSSFLKDIAAGRMVYVFIYPEKPTATIDGNYAWVYGRANIRFKLSGMIVNIDQYVSFAELYFYKRNKWQLVFCHNARIEKDAPYYNTTIPQVKGGEVPAIF
jgi:hypothetical protein